VLGSVPVGTRKSASRDFGLGGLKLIHILDRWIPIKQLQERKLSSITEDDGTVLVLLVKGMFHGP
jgi:hypothetical protein